MSKRETKAILHIGDAKCGSTAIQTSLSDSRTALGQHGVLYLPPDDHVSHLMHGKKSQTDRMPQKADPDDAARQKNIQDLNAVLDQGKSDYVIYSGEAFFRAPLERRQLLLATLPRLEQGFHAVVYLRDPVAHYLSWIQQTLKRRAKIRLPETFAVKLPKSIQSWSEEPLCRSLTLRHFDRDVLYKRSVVKDFQQVLTQFPGLQGIDLPERASNTSVFAEQMILLQQYRQTAMADREQVAAADVLHLFAAMEPHVGVALTKARLNEAAIQTVNRVNRKDNREMARMFPHIRFAPTTPAAPAKDISFDPDNVASVLRDYNPEAVTLLRALLPEFNADLADGLPDAVADIARQTFATASARAVYAGYLQRRQCDRAAAQIEAM